MKNYLFVATHTINLTIFAGGAGYKVCHSVSCLETGPTSLLGFNMPVAF